MKISNRVVNRMARLASLTLVTWLVGLICPASAAAATYYVAATGNNNNSCTAAQNIATPKQTITSGLTCLVAGDTLYIRSGVYPGRIDSNYQPIPVGTSWTSPVTIKAYPGETVTLLANSSGVLNLAASYIRYVIFDGLIFDGANLGAFGTSTISIWGGVNHVRIVNSEIKNSPSHGVSIFYGNGLSSDFNEFVNCKVHDNGLTDSLDHGFYISTSNNLVENCEVFNNKAHGVHVYAGNSGQSANNNIIRNNHIYGNGNTSKNGAGIISGSGGGTLIYNNVVHGNKDGILICCGTVLPANHKILNNTVYGNARWGIEVQSGTGHVVQNNIVRSNGAGDLRFLVTVVNSNNLTIDPLFANAAAGDFRLSSASPAVDAGVTLAEVQDDFAKVRRPQGAGYDLGAFEVQTGGQPPQAPTGVRLVQ